MCAGPAREVSDNREISDGTSAFQKGRILFISSMQQFGVGSVIDSLRVLGPAVHKKA